MFVCVGMNILPLRSAEVAPSQLVLGSNADAQFKPSRLWYFEVELIMSGVGCSLEQLS